MSKEEIMKVVDLQEELGNPLIVIHKPRSKENVTIFDSDTATFDVIGDQLLFDFWELDGFTIKLDKIKSITKSIVDNMTIVYLKLKYGNTVMLHFIE